MRELITVQKIVRGLRIIAIIAVLMNAIFAILSLLVATNVITYPTELNVFASEALNDALVQNNVRHTRALLYASMVGFASAAIGHSYFYRYLTNVIVDGTPFTFKGGKEIGKVGVSYIAITIVGGVIGTMILNRAGIASIKMSVGLIIMGIVLVILSYVLRYGSKLEMRSTRAEVTTDHLH